MFYVFSKIFWTLAQPLTLLALIFLLSLLFYRYVWAKKILIFAACIFVFCGFFPVGPLAVRALENQTDIPKNLPAHIDGVIVLGGAVNAEASEIRQQPQLNEWSERVFDMMRLSRAYPQAKILYSGGAGSWHGKKIVETEIVKKLLVDIGFPIKNFLFENSSRTTFENVVFSKSMVHPQAGEKWVLITSAFHMKRAEEVFKKQGWNVIPYPAGFIENGPLELWQMTDVSGNYWKLNIAAKEILGIIAYKISGRI